MERVPQSDGIHDLNNGIGTLSILPRTLDVVMTSRSMRSDMYARCIDDGLLYDDDIGASFWHTFDHLKLCADNGVVFNPIPYGLRLPPIPYEGGGGIWPPV